MSATAPAAVHIAAMAPQHAPQVPAIYQAGIDEGQATFETTAPTWEAFDTAKLPEHRLVALDESGSVLAWAAVVAVCDRCVETIQSGIFPQNTASLALHQRCGFRVVGTREKVGRHHGVWRDVVLVERRSPVIV